MADLKFYSVTEDTLDKVTQNNGNVIFLRDTGKIILDSMGERITYYTVVTLPTEAARLAMPLVKGLFFVEETLILYRCDGAIWLKVTEPPKEINVFIESDSDLPESPKEGVLYITNKSIYHYVNGQYVNLTVQQWENM